MTSHGNNDQLCGLLLKPLQLDKHICPVLRVYSHHMTSYLEAVGAVFKAYNRHCQLARTFCESHNNIISSVLFNS